MSSDRWFNPEKFEHARIRHGAPWGRPVRCLDTTPSTNDLALAAVSSDAKSGIVWIAKEQTHGRGRRGNAWQAPQGAGLLFSVLLRHQGPSTQLHGLSLAVGLGVRDAIASVLPDEDAEITVKWPNDVLARGKKVAGILVETRATKQSGLGLILGVGLNVRHEAFPPDLPNATSLKLLGVPEARLAPEDLLARCLKSLSARIGPFFTRGLASCLADLNEYDGLKGALLSVTDDQRSAPDAEPISGRGGGIDAEGRLMVLTDAGTIFIRSGHVQTKSQASGS